MRRSTGLAVAAGCVVLAGAVVTIGNADAAVTGGDVDAGSAIASPCPAGAVFGDPLPSAAVTATKIVDGFNFLEGPVWDAGSGTLLMSNLQNAAGAEAVQAASILRFTPPATVQTFIADSGSNGLALAPDGSSILAATQDERNVSSFRLSDRARGVVVADFQGRAFNSPNDLTVRADGTVYFSDPSFQRGNRADEQGGRTGVFRVTDGVATLVDDTLTQPNGVVLSPDAKTLYVGADDGIFAYPVAADGSTGTRTKLAALATPDGATIDCAGNLYWASFDDGKVHVLDPQGRELGTISAGRNTTNVAFGGDDRRTLFITSGETGNFGLFSVRLNVPGFPF